MPDNAPACGAACARRRTPCQRNLRARQLATFHRPWVRIDCRKAPRMPALGASRQSERRGQRRLNGPRQAG
ncbi:hypothetical protein NOCARDAX2BIS_520144 [Nocardioides sp. AX2bis]|nr:hypothetical protein NOCARDAX2BIS_520144 [Nocardioides sp. AX2bis]